MKVESLNIWGGRVFEPLMEHISRQRNSVDVFCLQEVYSTPTTRIYTRDIPNRESFPAGEQPPRANIYQELSRILPEHTGYFRSSIDMADYLGVVDFELSYGLAMFIRNDINVKSEDEIFVYLQKSDFVPGDNTTIPKQVQYARIESSNREYTIANFHGIWTGEGKGDTESRIEQSKKIQSFLSSVDGAKVLCGDFNLLPGTRSLELLEENMHNLIKEYGITSTRSEFYTKPEKFADYILVSPEVQVVDFKVLQDPVSDHLPLQIVFS